MGKSYVVGINEIACVAVLIPTEKLGLPQFNNDAPPKEPMTEESRQKINELIGESKQFGGVGSTIVDLKYFAILIDCIKWREKGRTFFDWCSNKGYEPKVADRSVIVDKRYADGGIYEGVQVDIPPQYIDDAIRNLIKTYCDEVHVSQIVQDGILMFEGELYPEKKITIMYNRSFIGGGLDTNIAFVGESPTRDYKRILNAIEESVKVWIEEHKGIYHKQDA